MAETIVNLAISKGVELVGNVVFQEVSALRAVRGDIQYLIDELKVMSPYVRSAEEKQLKDDAAKAWVQQVRKLAYSIEDCIEEFSFHIGCHQGLPVGPLRGLKRSLKSLGSLRARCRIAKQIKSIKSEVKIVSDRRLQYEITTVGETSSSTASQYQPRLAALSLEDSQLIGIDKPREDILRWLGDKETRELSLVAVVGAGGIGKTTLVRKVYESSRLIDMGYTCRAWITVSQVYNLEGLLRALIKQVVPSPRGDLDAMGSAGLIDILLKKLSNESYLIIFDDIWDIRDWKNLEPALPKNSFRSRIVITTRNLDVAEAVTELPSYIYEHLKLSDEHSMDLFCRRVFLDAGYRNNLREDIKDLCCKILEKCDGLPLAIVSIAGVLASKRNKTREEMEEILSCLGTELECNKSLEGMKKVLMLSYSDLPYDVKHCFSYLSKFPEDYLISRATIKKLWVAEGFIASRRGMSVYKVAETYFNDLACRFLIIPVGFNTSGKVKTFRVHDILWELLVSKSAEEGRMTLAGEMHDQGWMQRDAIRCLSIHGEELGDVLSNSNTLKLCRSLTMFGVRRESVMDALLCRHPMRLLRVLHLNFRCCCLENHHLEVVGHLFHLRYLSFSQNGAQMPKSFKNLENLQFCVLSGDDQETRLVTTSTSTVSDVFWEGPKFINVYWFLARGLGGMRSLQVLPCLNLKWCSEATARELGMLTRLRKLRVIGIQKQQGSALIESLKAMRNNLRSLHLGSSETLSFLHGLDDSASLLLESLTLDGQLGGRLPRWILSLTHLRKLILWHSRLTGSNDDDIKLLGALPHLVQLYLTTHTFASHRATAAPLCFAAGEFPRLKYLWLEGAPPPVIFQPESLPLLEYLYVDCVGQVSGVENLQGLKESRLPKVQQE